jgi:hypothetical protein
MSGTPAVALCPVRRRPVVGCDFASTGGCLRETPTRRRDGHDEPVTDADVEFPVTVAAVDHV